jgi:hypothetical protein
MTSIEVELEYRSVARSFSRWGPKEESNAPIVAESEVADFFEVGLAIGLVHDSYRGRARLYICS